MNEVMLDISLTESSVNYKCDSLKDLKTAIRKLGLYDKKFTHFTGLSDTLTEEYIGFLFFSSRPTNLEDKDIHAMNSPSGGKILALLLLNQSQKPVLNMFHQTLNAKLGGWKLSGGEEEGEFYLRAERILLGSTKKVN